MKPVHWGVLVLGMLALFVAVAAGTYVGLTIAFPADSIDVQVCVPEHAIMPEDLGRPDRDPIPMECT